MTRNSSPWSRDLLKKRGLDGPDGRPLYAYRVTEAELEALTGALQAELSGIDGGRLPDPTAQLFCLFAAECWRLDAPTEWSWTTLLAACRARGVELTRPMAGQAVTAGLGLWKRSPVLTRGPRIQLVTLACEGGFPDSVLVRDGAVLGRFWRALLDDYAALHATGLTAVELAEGAADTLPPRLRQDVLCQLHGQLIEEIWRLRQGLGESLSSVDDLDRSDKDWRLRLPLDPENATAWSLVDSLVEAAARLPRPLPPKLVLRRWLVAAGDDWRLAAALEMPSHLDGGRWGELLGLGEDELPARRELALKAPDAVRIPVAQVVEVAAHAANAPARLFFFERLEDARTPGPTAAGPFGIDVGFGKNARTLEVPGTAGLDDDLPWIFTRSHDEDDHRLALAGQGSVATQEAVCFVVPAARWSVESGEMEKRGELLELGRVVYEVRGEVLLSEDSGGRHCRIRPRSLDDDADIAADAAVPPPPTPPPPDPEEEVEIPPPPRPDHPEGAYFLDVNGQVLGIDAEVTIDRMAGVLASATSSDEKELFFLEGALNALDAEEHEGLMVSEELDQLGPGHFVFDLGALRLAVRHMLSVSSDPDAFVRMRITSSGENFRPRSLHVGRYDVELEHDAERGEVVLSRAVDPELDPSVLRLLPLRLSHPGGDEALLPESDEPGRWKLDTESCAPGSWLIMAAADQHGPLGDGSGESPCRVRPLPFTVAAEETAGWSDLQRAVYASPPETRDEALAQVFAHLAENPAAEDWSLVYHSLRLLKCLPPAVLPLPAALIEHRGAAAMALLSASHDLPLFWDLLEELPFAWWEIPVRTWVRTARACQERLASFFASPATGRSRAAKELRRALRAMTTLGPFMAPVTEWIEVEVLKKNLMSTQLALPPDALHHVLREERQALFHRTTDHRWPEGRRVNAWMRENAEHFPERVAALRRIAVGVPGFKRAVLAGPVVASVASVYALPLDRPTFYELRRLQDFDREWFDTAQMLVLRIAMGIVREEDSAILR